LIGVLALQGAFLEHRRMLDKIGAASKEVRLPKDLEGIEALIFPGGESTTITKLIDEYGLRAPLINLIQNGMPVLGTCAGMVVLAKEISGEQKVKPLGLMDIAVKRNAYGRQKESFETELKIDILGEKPFPAVFIRAPYIEKWGDEVKILATYQKKGVLAQQKNMLVASFHPELTLDDRLHRYFFTLTPNHRDGSSGWRGGQAENTVTLRR